MNEARTQWGAGCRCPGVLRPGGRNRGDVDVVLPVSPEIWGTAKNGANSPPAQPCNRCCVYQNQNYSEGAVLKVEGEVLQCVREPNTIGTNPLIWVRLKK